MRRYKNKDWCSVFPDKSLLPPRVYIGSACYFHDENYKNKNINRLKADNLLFKHVKDLGAPFTACIMWIGVRLFGWLYY